MRNERPWNRHTVVCSISSRRHTYLDCHARVIQYSLQRSMKRLEADSPADPTVTPETRTPETRNLGQSPEFHCLLRQLSYAHSAA